MIAECLSYLLMPVLYLDEVCMDQLRQVIDIDQVYGQARGVYLTPRAQLNSV